MFVCSLMQWLRAQELWMDLEAVFSHPVLAQVGFINMEPKSNVQRPCNVLVELPIACARCYQYMTVYCELLTSNMQ